MITVTITTEDLEGIVADAHDCPGYRAVKRQFPSLEVWLFDYGYLEDNTRIEAVDTTVYEKLRQQHEFQMRRRDTPIEPFSFTVRTT